MLLPTSLLCCHQIATVAVLPVVPWCAAACVTVMLLQWPSCHLSCCSHVAVGQLCVMPRCAAAHVAIGLLQWPRCQSCRHRAVVCCAVALCHGLLSLPC